MREISPVKKQMVSDMTNIIASSNGSYFVTYKGLTVAAFSELRRSLDAVEAQIHVVPNALMEIVALNAGLISDRSELALTGDTALVTGGTDPLQTAKILKEFQKKNEVVVTKLGFLDGEKLSAAQVEALANIPAREVLYAMVIGMLQNAPRSLVCLLNAKAKEMEASAGN